MPIDGVVVNASPLITLFKSGQTALLPALFQQIHVPDALWREISDARPCLEALRAAAGLWLSDSVYRAVLAAADERP